MPGYLGSVLKKIKTLLGMKRKTKPTMKKIIENDKLKILYDLMSLFYL